MRWVDAIVMARRSVGRRGGRALLTVLAVALGTALLSSMLIASTAARQRVLNQVSSGGPLAGIKVDAAAPSATALDSDSPRPGPARVIDDAARVRIAKLANVQSVVPVIATPMAVLPSAASAGTPRRDNRPIFDTVVGVDLARAADLPITLLSGRLPDPAANTEVAVTIDYLHRIGVDKANAASVVGTELTLGAPRAFAFGHEQRVRARWSRAIVVGVVAQEASDGLVLAPLSFVRSAREWTQSGIGRELFGGSASPYTALFVVARGLEHVTDVRAEINVVGYSTSAPESLITQVQRYLHVVELVLSGIGIIALSIAALGISNAMLAAIRERRREIGVLKALGATDADVRRVFIVEAGALGAVGGGLGAAVGLLTAHALAGVVNRYLSSEALETIHLGVPFRLLLVVVLGATVLALAAGVLPALRAARMPARQAMGDE